jgi:hypothetical protein
MAGEQFVGGDVVEHARPRECRLPKKKKPAARCRRPLRGSHLQTSSRCQRPASPARMQDESKWCWMIRDAVHRRRRLWPPGDELSQRHGHCRSRCSAAARGGLQRDPHAALLAFSIGGRPALVANHVDYVTVLVCCPLLRRTPTPTGTCPRAPYLANRMERQVGRYCAASMLSPFVRAPSLTCLCIPRLQLLFRE